MPIESEADVDSIPLGDLTGFQRDLLTIICQLDEPTSGQGILQKIEDDVSKSVNHGRLYPNLDVLVEEGYVDKGQIDRRTNSYGATQKAYEGLRDRVKWEFSAL